MTRRATKRGAQRTSLDGVEADVLICGASFAGLAVARELAGAGVEVLVLDRYEIGERATSACAAPTPWLEAMGLAGSIRQEIPCMAFHTPHRSVRYRLPWTWSAFDYRELCRLLWAQCAQARFESATVTGRAEQPRGGSAALGTESITVNTDRGRVSAPFVVDALGWRRVLAARGYQPPEAPLSRGLEVHPQGGGEDLDVWIDRSLVRRGYGWSVPADGEQRVGVGSYEPRDTVKRPTVELAARLARPAVRYQGNWFPHRLRPATEDGVCFVGDSSGHCFPLSGEGIRTALYFGIACGRELRRSLAGEATRSEALERYGAFSDRHAPAFGRALRLQRLIPALPPRVLAALLALVGRQWLVDRSFGWYLDQAHPSFAATPP
ncbi:MAG: NAD(P)/FAD-dependent oxidoreductase [Thermoleophilaceae bacterium]|nr:NAD(P)/FAD-dependent oxidoreductase [Thermoleophilaceae bacterium]